MANGANNAARKRTQQSMIRCFAEALACYQRGQTSAAEYWQKQAYYKGCDAYVFPRRTDNVRGT